MFVHDDGTEMTFPGVVSAVLVKEHGRTESDAKALVDRYSQIVMNGIMGGMAYRATALALEMKENEDAKATERGKL